jgi:hypothetical protein
MVVVGAGGVVVARVGAERSVESTVRGFFGARQAGDCEGLLDYLDEASWSEGGRLGRDEFVARCEDVVGIYHPELADLAVVSETRDTAVVQIGVPLADGRVPASQIAFEDRPQGLVVRAPGLTDEEADEVGAYTAYEQGELIHDASTWRVRLDAGFLRIGRSIEQTIADYLRAYREGECEDATGFLSAAARAGRQGVVDRCETLADRSAELRRDLPEDPAVHGDIRHPSVVSQPSSIEVDALDHDRVTAETRWVDTTTVEADRITQTVGLVRQDLAWRLTDPSLAVVRTAELTTRLLAESDVGLPPGMPALVHPETSAEPFEAGPRGYEGTDATEQRRRHGFRAGLAASYGGVDDGVELVVYELADAEAARGYADRFGDRVAADSTWHQPLPPAAVTGADGSLAVVTECAGPSLRPASMPVGCDHADKAAAVGARGRFVVAVEVTDHADPDPTSGDLVARATTLLRAQLTRL